MDSLRSQLLVASPQLTDPNFARTVLLITEHNDAGAMGIVLNRPATTTVVAAAPGPPPPRCGRAARASPGPAGRRRLRGLPGPAVVGDRPAVRGRARGFGGP